MSITANTYVLEAIPSAGKDWNVSLASEDISGCEEIKAAESGYTHYITDLHIRADAAIDVSIGSGETTGAVTTVHIGPIPLAAASGYFFWRAPRGMGLKCTAGAAFTIDAGAGTIWIEARGRTCKVTV